MSLNEPVAGAISGAQAPKAPPVLAEGVAGRIRASSAGRITSPVPTRLLRGIPPLLEFNRRSISEWPCGRPTSADLRLNIAMPGDGRRNRSRGLRSIGYGRCPSGRRES